MIVGLIPATKGRVLLNGEDITRLKMHQRARRGIGYLPQEPSVFRKLTVEENIMAILEAVHVPRSERKARLATSTSRSSAWARSPSRRPTRSRAGSAAASRSPAPS
jgi:ABC-type lipopolysaccharide export system ATPase subunit